MEKTKGRLGLMVARYALAATLFFAPFGSASSRGEQKPPEGKGGVGRTPTTDVLRGQCWNWRNFPHGRIIQIPSCDGTPTPAPWQGVNSYGSNPLGTADKGQKK